MNLSNWIIGGAVVIALILSVFALNKSPVSPPLGAAGPSLSNNGGCWDANGLTRCDYSKGLTANASTTCEFQIAATSTLVFASVKVASSSSAASIWEFGKGTRDATTTLIGGTVALGAATQGTIVASTTVVANPDDIRVFKPGSWFNIKTNADTIKGTCTAEFIIN